MQKFRFVHTADLHLDSPFKGISKTNDYISSQLQEATFKAYDKIIDICIKNKVDFVLISGDIYNGADRSLRAQLKFRDGMRRLDNAKINAYIVHGNHDPLDGWSHNLDWPGNVHVFGGTDVERVVFEKESKEVVEIYGISFQQKETRICLAKRFPEKVHTGKRIFTVGMLHCNLGNRTGHEQYAPCTLKDLLSKKYDYWALGHIHKKSIINNNNPLIVYPGNPQGLHHNEGGKRGCYLVECDTEGESAARFIETGSVIWYTENLSIEDINSIEDLIKCIMQFVEKTMQKTEGRLSLLRIILTGRGVLHSTLMRKNFLDDVSENVREQSLLEGYPLWLENIVDNTSPPIGRDSLLERKDFIGDLVRYFEEISASSEELEHFKQFILPLFSSDSGMKLLQPLDNDYILSLVKKAENLCLDQLLDDKDPHEN